MSSEKSKNKSATHVGKLQWAVLFRTLLPLVVMGVFISIITTNAYEKAIKNEIKIALESVGSTVAGYYDSLYPGDYELVGDKNVSLYKGENELTGDFSYIDTLKEQSGLDITLFYGNTRILTTLKNGDGERYVATGVNSAVFNKVDGGHEKLVTEVDVDGMRFYACYIPVLNSDGQMMCMIGTAKSINDITATVQRASYQIWIIVFLAMLVAALISQTYTSKIISSIAKIQKFLNGISEGKLNNVMPPEVLKRDDELGDAAHAVVEMQKAMSILVERDPLTQLYNRRYGNAKLAAIRKKLAESGEPFALVMGDIDFFKKVNDTYGHDAGDAVLVTVSDLLKKFMVGKGFAARWGGEEFVLAFDKNSGDEANIFMWNFLDRIRKVELPYGDLTIKITMTFGVIDGSASEDYEELLKMADDRLYYGKMSGRNRVVNEEDYQEWKATGETFEELKARMDAESSRDDEAGEKTETVIPEDKENKDNKKLNRVEIPDSLDIEVVDCEVAEKILSNMTALPEETEQDPDNEPVETSDEQQEDTNEVSD